MNEIDTHEIRELVGDYTAIPPAPSMGPGWTDIIRNLCDALDEAREQLTREGRQAVIAGYKHAVLRAELAEQDARNYKLERDAAHIEVAKHLDTIKRVRDWLDNANKHENGYVFTGEVLNALDGGVS